MKLQKIIDKIERTLKQIDKESSKCKRCKNNTYCKEHMLMYRRIETIGNELQQLTTTETFKCENCNEEEVEHQGDWCDGCNLPERSPIK